MARRQFFARLHHLALTGMAGIAHPQYLDFSPPEAVARLVLALSVLIPAGMKQPLSARPCSLLTHQGLPILSF